MERPITRPESTEPGEKSAVENARERRAEMLADLTETVRLCVCEWPLTKYRNGDGHDPGCPAHRPLGGRRG